ncbi:hypothetical protein [Parathermosynechococcus lividus]
MKIGIITIGKRQVGWRSRDGIVRSFGADGGSDPPHVDDLYREFGQKRGQGDAAEPKSQHGVRHLGELAYRHCLAQRDFSAVVLLLDQVVLEECFSDSCEPADVILVATDQPQTVAWQFYRDDTCWLAELMAGAIRQRFPHITVRVWVCHQPLSETETVRAWIAQQLQQYLKICPEGGSLYLQLKGSAPQLASAVEMIAVIAMRQFSISISHLIPVEPTPFFAADSQSARFATTLKIIHLGEAFWPLEQQRIEMAWQQGHFMTASVLLEPHRDRHEALYQLAKRLAMATNWQIKEMLKQLQGQHWLDQRATKQVTTKAQRQQWQQAISQRCPAKAETRESKFLKIWESELLIELSLRQTNYTFAFMQFAQMLERLLFLRYDTENWREQRYLEPPTTITWQGEPSLGSLWRGWATCHGRSAEDPLVKRLERINQYRNSVVHRSAPMSRTQLQDIAATSGDTPEHIHGGLLQLLEEIADPRPNLLLMRSLYGWGLEQLRLNLQNR